MRMEIGNGNRKGQYIHTYTYIYIDIYNIWIQCILTLQQSFMKKIIFTENAPAPIGPYNQADLKGNTLYTSGQIAINPATGELRNHLGKPQLVYQPWEYGSPWTKKTALWGDFNIPPKKYTDWNKVPKNDKLYVRPGRPKPALAFLHKSAVDLIPEMQWAKESIKCDADIRSMCSRGFAQEFFKNNR